MDFFYIIHIIISILLIVVVLFQDGKAGGLTSVADSSQAVFGAKGATNFLTKLTSTLAVVFMCSSLFLAFKEAPKEKSIASDFVPETTSSFTDDAKATATGDEQSDAPAYEVVPLDQVPDEVLSEQDRALKAKEDQKPDDGAAEPADQNPAKPPAGQQP